MKILTIVFLSILSLSSNVLAESAEEKGLAIAQEADTRDSGWGAFTSDIKMTLTNRQGQKSVREIRSKTLEVEGDGDKSLTIFDKPRDVQGTALLSFTHKTGADDQWLYLPALKRVKRISSNNKSGPFMGSEFAYEDITSQEVEKYTYKYLKDDSLDGMAVYVFERYPVDKKSGYTRQVVYMDIKDHKERKIEYFDRKNSALKTLTLTGYQQYKGKYWRPQTMHMVNHQTGKSTTLEQTNFDFDAQLRDADFNKNALKRAR